MRLARRSTIAALALALPLGLAACGNSGSDDTAAVVHLVRAQLVLELLQHHRPRR